MSSVSPNGTEALSPEQFSGMEYLDLHSLDRLHQDITQVTQKLNQNDIAPLLRPIVEKSLHERVQEFGEGLMSADLVEVTFTRRMTTHLSSYRALLDTFGDPERATDDDYTIVVPGNAVQSVIGHTGQLDVGHWEPSMWLKVKTGHEKPTFMMPARDAVKDGLVVDDPQGRWYNFPLDSARFTALSR